MQLDDILKMARRLTALTELTFDFDTITNLRVSSSHRRKAGFRLHHLNLSLRSTDLQNSLDTIHTYFPNIATLTLSITGNAPTKQSKPARLPFLLALKIKRLPDDVTPAQIMLSCLHRDTLMRLEELECPSAFSIINTKSLYYLIGYTLTSLKITGKDEHYVSLRLYQRLPMLKTLDLHEYEAKFDISNVIADVPASVESFEFNAHYDVTAFLLNLVLRPTYDSFKDIQLNTLVVHIDPTCAGTPFAEPAYMAVAWLPLATYFKALGIEFFVLAGEEEIVHEIRTVKRGTKESEDVVQAIEDEITQGKEKRLQKARTVTKEQLKRTKRDLNKID